MSCGKRTRPLTFDFFLGRARPRLQCREQCPTGAHLQDSSWAAASGIRVEADLRPVAVGDPSMPISGLFPSMLISLLNHCCVHEPIFLEVVLRVLDMFRVPAGTRNRSGVAGGGEWQEEKGKSRAVACGCGLRARAWLRGAGCALSRRLFTAVAGARGDRHVAFVL